jgi:hypothetical protein
MPPAQRRSITAALSVPDGLLDFIPSLFNIANFKEVQFCSPGFIQTKTEISEAYGLGLLFAAKTFTRFPGLNAASEPIISRAARAKTR